MHRILIVVVAIAGIQRRGRAAPGGEHAFVTSL